MEITEKKQKAPPVAKATESEEERLFEALVTGKDITEDIETRRGTFTVKYLTFADIVTVGNIVASRNNYQPVSAFSAEAQRLNAIASYLDVAVVEYPDWFKRAREKNAAFSFADVPDDELLIDLYNRGCLFRDKVLGNLRPKKDGKVPRPAAATAAQETVGGGVFEGMSGSTGV